MTGDYAQNPTININDPMNEALATIPAINPNLARFGLMAGIVARASFIGSLMFIVGF
jgi:hypothetical protein